jgi:hypothetical protein
VNTLFPPTVPREGKPSAEPGAYPDSASPSNVSQLRLNELIPKVCVMGSPFGSSSTWVY